MHALRADGNMYCTTKLEDAPKPSFSFPSPPSEKMTALVDKFLELFYSQTRRWRLQNAGSGKNRKKEAQD